jgi:Heterokaryon incompatibility protein (HET)
MRQIYLASLRTLVCLGPDPDGLGKTAIAYLHQIRDTLMREMNLFEWNLAKADDIRPICNEIWDLHGNLDADLETWTALHWLYSRPWFNRLWVIQELNSSKEAVSVCGDSSIDAHFVALIAECIRQQEVYFNFRFDKTNVSQASMMRWNHYRSSDDILMTLHCASSYATTDPRDRIYAMMGLSSFAKLYGEIIIDYSLSTIEAYRKVCGPIMRLSRTLQAFSFVIHPRFTETIPHPSWIPRWDVNNNYPVIWSIEEWNACSGTTALATLNEGSSTITVSGIRIDTVSNHYISRVVDSLFPFPGNAGLDTGATAMNWKQLLRPTKRYKLDKNGIKAYAAALLCGLDQEENRGNEDDLYKDFISYVTSTLGQQTPLPECCQEEAARLPSMGLHDEIWYRRRVNIWCYNRTVFTTNSGYIGSGHRCLQSGDIVCILYGGAVPFILRPEDDHYLMIGEAYVHGLMDGEAVKDNAKWMEPEEFVIH